MDYKKLSDSLNCPDEDVIAAYTGLLKTTEEERQINCRCCGFGTCEQMVVAIILGMRHNEDCVLYAQKKLQEMQAETIKELKNTCNVNAEKLLAIAKKQCDLSNQLYAAAKVLVDRMQSYSNSIQIE